MAFNASRIREETRPWPKYESQGAVESEDQLLFFAAATTKRLLLKAASYHQRPKTPKTARPPSYVSLSGLLLLWPRSLWLRQILSQIYTYLSPLFSRHNFLPWSARALLSAQAFLAFFLWMLWPFFHFWMLTLNLVT